MLAFVSDTGIIIAVIAFVMLFGASQIPKMARNIGEAGREFRRAHAEAGSPHAPAPVAPVPMSPGTSDGQVTLTKAEYDALLADRDARAHT